MNNILKDNYDEIIKFMCMCNDKDRDYIRKISLGNYVYAEEYVRLIALARVLDNKTIFTLLDSSYENSRGIMCDYIKIVSLNRTMLYNWVESFIENIQFDDLKDYAKKCWGWRIKKIEEEPKLIRELFFGKW